MLVDSVPGHAVERLGLRRGYWLIHLGCSDPDLDDPQALTCRHSAWVTTMAEADRALHTSAPRGRRRQPRFSATFARTNPISTWQWVHNLYGTKELYLIFQAGPVIIIWDRQERYMALKQPFVWMADFDGAKWVGMSRIQALADSHPDDTFRVYETPNGLHCFCTSRPLRHCSRQALRWAIDAGGDYRYAAFSYVTEYGHRLNPRVWARAGGITDFVQFGSTPDFVSRPYEEHFVGKRENEREELVAVVELLAACRRVVTGCPASWLQWLEHGHLRAFADSSQEGDFLHGYALFQIARKIARDASVRALQRQVQENGDVAADECISTGFSDVWAGLRGKAPLAEHQEYAEFCTTIYAKIVSISVVALVGSLASGSAPADDAVLDPRVAGEAAVSPPGDRESQAEASAQFLAVLVPDSHPEMPHPEMPHLAADSQPEARPGPPGAPGSAADPGPGGHFSQGDPLGDWARGQPLAADDRAPPAAADGVPDSQPPPAGERAPADFSQRSAVSLPEAVLPATDPWEIPCSTSPDRQPSGMQIAPSPLRRQALSQPRYSADRASRTVRRFSFRDTPGEWRASSTGPVHPTGGLVVISEGRASEERAAASGAAVQPVASAAPIAPPRLDGPRRSPELPPDPDICGGGGAGAVPAAQPSQPRASPSPVPCAQSQELPPPPPPPPAHAPPPQQQPQRVNAEDGCDAPGSRAKRRRTNGSPQDIFERGHSPDHREGRACFPLNGLRNYARARPPPQPIPKPARVWQRLPGGASASCPKCGAECTYWEGEANILQRRRWKRWSPCARGCIERLVTERPHPHQYIWEEDNYQPAV